MDRLQFVSIAGAAGLLLIVFELVRRRRLMERYALLWLLSSFVLVTLAGWRNLLEQVSKAVGVATPVNALFVVAFGFVLVLLLHFSLVISKLADQSSVLAQEAALLRHRLDELDERTTPAAGQAPDRPPLHAGDRTR
jgi:hypothetical protein